MSGEIKKENLRILVVDDHPMTRNMVRAILRGVGYSSVDLAESAIQAQGLVKERQYDLIICDWNMPLMSGLEFLNVVRELFRNLPFIMLTAEVYKENVEAAIEAGVSDYVIKPFTAEVLCTKVERVLKKNMRIGSD